MKKRITSQRLLCDGFVPNITFEWDASVFHITEQIIKILFLDFF